MMQERLGWHVGFFRVDHYGCPTLQHTHMGGNLHGKRNERKKQGWITPRLSILLGS